MKKIEILFRKLLLKLLLLSVRKPLVFDLQDIPVEPNILFIRLNRIGDALISTPLLGLIKRELHCHVFVLASRNNWFIFNNPKIVDEVIVYDKNKISLFGLIKLLKQKHFDVVVDLHDDVSSTVSYITAFMKSKYKFALKKANEKIYSHTIEKLDPKTHHVVDRVLEFAKLFKVEQKSSLNILFEASNNAAKFSQEYLRNHFIENKFLIGINISAGSEARFWGIENYKKLIETLTEYDVNIIIMCIERDMNYAIEISGNLCPIFYSSDFDKFSAMVGNLDLLITPDTSIIHIGSAYQKPIFGLYVKYNTNDMIWSPYKSPFECVITEEPTLKNVKFETVKEKLIPFFEKYYYEYSTKSN